MSRNAGAYDVSGEFVNTRITPACSTTYTFSEMPGACWKSTGLENRKFGNAIVSASLDCELHDKKIIAILIREHNLINSFTLAIVLDIEFERVQIVRRSERNTKRAE